MRHSLNRYKRILALNRIEPFRKGRALWLTLASTLILSLVMVFGALSPSDHRIEQGFHVEFVVICNAILFLALYSYNFAIIRLSLSRSRLVAAGIAGTVLIVALLTLVAFGLEVAIYGHSFTGYPLSLIINSSSGGMAYLVTLLIYNITEYQQAVLENERLQAENLRIRTETLEQQLSPHYLFNSLNTLDGLIGIDDDRAHTYLAKLAATFRYLLQQNKVVSLADEMEFTHYYIYMMQLRYGDALRIEEHIDGHLLGRSVVPISVQLLVENAIKHNVVTTRHPLLVSIRTTPGGSLVVSNQLHPKADSGSSNGVGLANLNQRYRLAFQREIVIQQDNTSFTVEIPLI